MLSHPEDAPVRIRPILATSLLAAFACTGPTAANAPAGSAPSAASAGAIASQGFDWVDATKSAGPLASQLVAAARAATASGRQPIAYLHADWCPPCNAIDATIHDPQMAAAFAGTYVLRIDHDAFTTELAGVGLDVGALPTLVKLDDEGRSTGATIAGGAWGDNVPENMAPPLRAFFTQG